MARIDLQAPQNIVVEVQSSTKRVIIHNEENSVSVLTNEPKVFRIVEKGNQGATGARGASAGGLFYQISDTPITYTTTSSIALFDLSSSILPFTSSTYNTTLNLGSSTRPWARNYVSSTGIFFVTPSTGASVNLRAGTNYIAVGDTKLFSGSMQITGSLKIKSNGNSNIAEVYSASAVQLKINENGILVLTSQNTLPAGLSGGIVFSGSGLYIGV